MIGAKEYVIKRSQLMKEYEEAARKWLGTFQCDVEIVRMLPFLADGVCSPEVWFSEENNFRPLFIMKEASIGINCKSELKSYYIKWGKRTYFEHVEDPFSDIKIGVNKFSSNNPWKRIAKLAKGLEILCKRQEICDYKSLDIFSFEKGGRKNPNNLSNDPVYEYQTANQNYLSVINQIAVINIKKLAGGTNVGSELSLASGWYLDHINNENKELQNLFIKQINLIEPTVIVCCGKESGKSISEYLPNEIRQEYQKKIVDCPHPSRSSNDKFFYGPIKRYAELNNILYENSFR